MFKSSCFGENMLKNAEAKISPKCVHFCLLIPPTFPKKLGYPDGEKLLNLASLLLCAIELNQTKLVALVIGVKQPAKLGRGSHLVMFIILLLLYTISMSIDILVSR